MPMNANNRTLQAAQHRVFNEQMAEGETLKYTIDYAPLLNGATITASAWEHAGVTLAGTNTTTTATAAISGSTGRYAAINTVTLSNGEVLQRIINLHINSNKTQPVQGDY